MNYEDHRAQSRSFRLDALPPSTSHRPHYRVDAKCMATFLQARGKDHSGARAVSIGIANAAHAIATGLVAGTIYVCEHQRATN